MNKKELQDLLAKVYNIQQIANMAMANPDNFRSFIKETKPYLLTALPEDYNVFAVAAGLMWSIADSLEIDLEGLIEDE